MRTIIIAALIALKAGCLTAQAAVPAAAVAALARPAAGGQTVGIPGGAVRATVPTAVTVSVLPRSVLRSDRRISLSIRPDWDFITKGPGLVIGLKF